MDEKPGPAITRTLREWNREFRTEEDCLAELEKVRWPEGVRCPTCGAEEISQITRKPEVKNKRTRSFQCLEKTCRLQFIATRVRYCIL